MDSTHRDSGSCPPRRDRPARRVRTNYAHVRMPRLPQHTHLPRANTHNRQYTQAHSTYSHSLAGPRESSPSGRRHAMPHYQISHTRPKNHEARTNTHPNPLTNPEARTCTQRYLPPPPHPAYPTNWWYHYGINYEKHLNHSSLTDWTALHSQLATFLTKASGGCTLASKDQGWTLPRPDHTLWTATYTNPPPPLPP